MLNLLNEANNSKFITSKWNIINDSSKSNYDKGNEVIYKKFQNLIFIITTMFTF